MHILSISLFLSLSLFPLPLLSQVLECNGEKILNLKHLVTLIEQGEKDGPNDKFQVPSMI